LFGGEKEEILRFSNLIIFAMVFIAEEEIQIPMMPLLSLAQLIAFFVKMACRKDARTSENIFLYATSYSLFLV